MARIPSKVEVRKRLLAEQKKAAQPPPVPPEHPEDRAARLEGEEYGRRHAAEFCATHAADFEPLIGTYSDATAEELLFSLRERFWAQVWKPAVAQPPADKEG